jgi:hypothetical protein
MFIVTSQNSLAFQDVELGLESYAETIPETNSRGRLTSRQKIMKALSSAELRYSSKKKSHQIQDHGLQTSGGRGREPKPRDNTSLSSEVTENIIVGKVATDIKTERSSAVVLLDINGECAPANESGDRPAHPRRLKETLFSAKLGSTSGEKNPHV